MPQRRWLEWVYGGAALVALGVTWAFNLSFLSAGHGLLDFLEAGFANAAAASLSSDLAVLAVVACVFVVVEGRRTGVPRLWIYLALIWLVAASVGFPLFLLARQRRLARQAI
jgi:hypothetical protein